MSVCSKCGKEIPEGSQFCPNCGGAATPAVPESGTIPNKKTKKCKVCGAQIAKSAKTCPYCGAKNKKHTFLIILGIIFAIILISSIGGKKDSDTSDVSSSSESKQASESSTSSTAQAVEEKSEYHVGDTIMDGDLEIVYVASGDYTSDNQFIQPADGNKYVFFEFACENTGSSGDESVSYFSFECYADGYAAEGSYFQDDLLSATLSPGRTTTGRVYFEVPKDASEIELEYEVNVFTDKKVKIIYDGNADSGYVIENNVTSTENAVQPGDTIEVGNLKISYISCGDYTSDNMFIQPSEGNKFVKLELEFENTGSSDEYVSSFLFDCYADGASCESNYAGDDQLSATISSGRKTKGNVIFEVPVNAEIIEAEYVNNFWTSDRIVFKVK